MAIVSSVFTKGAHGETGVLTFVDQQLTLGDLHDWIDHVLNSEESGPAEVDAIVGCTTTTITVTPSAVTGY